MYCDKALSFEAYLAAIVQITPNQMTRGCGPPGSLVDFDAGVDLLLLTHGVGIRVHPSTIAAIKSFGNGRQIIESTC